MKVSEVDKEIDGALALIKAVRDILIKQVKGFPDNPKINRSKIFSGAFTMKSSDLDENMTLSPEYYDFKASYGFIVNALRSAPYNKVGSLLRKIVETGEVKVVYSKRTMNFRRQKLHPDVIENLKPLL